MVAAVPFIWQMTDSFCALGLGMVLAVLYDILRLFLPATKPVVFFCDFFICVFSAAVVFSYAVSLSKSGVLRWYIVLGTALGYIGYLAVLAPFTGKLRRMLHFVVSLPFRLFWRYICHPAGAFIKKQGKAFQAKKKNRMKRRKKQLQKKGKVLYNSN
ncbi:MAG: spore cortex biosynthesis protein YabQ [Oscillospiraceae bacterium]|nr:spore cortex biosynthesis protein YabQ [Oscillospiraceae bacterium]